MWRTFRVLLLAGLLPIASALPAAAATPANPAASLGLSALWSKVFQTPSPRNPFGDGGIAYACLKVAPGLVSAFGPGGAPACTVPRGTFLLVTPATNECSTFEGSAPSELRSCATGLDAGVTDVSLKVDNRPVALSKVQTIPIPIVLPADNIFGAPARATGLSVGDGWVAFVKPAPGTHIIYETAGGHANTTIITVMP